MKTERIRAPGGDESPMAAAPLENRLLGALGEMQRRSATVLELAATMHWLAVAEARADWQSELRRRKGVKTHDGREQQARDLLHAPGLPPALSA